MNKHNTKTKRPIKTFKKREAHISGSLFGLLAKECLLAHAAVNKFLYCETKNKPKERYIVQVEKKLNTIIAIANLLNTKDSSLSKRLNRCMKQSNATKPLNSLNTSYRENIALCLCNIKREAINIQGKIQIEDAIKAQGNLPEELLNCDEDASLCSLKVYIEEFVQLVDELDGVKLWSFGKIKDSQQMILREGLK